MIALLLATLLVSAIEVDAPPPYRADGSEPFWSLEITRAQLTYHREEQPLSVPLPQRRRTANGYRYETASIIVDIKHEDCTDEAATIRSDSVTVIVGDETVHGCGGELLGSEFGEDTPSS